MSPLRVALGRRGALVVSRRGPRVLLALPSGVELSLTRRQAWQLAEALDRVATAGETG